MPVAMPITAIGLIETNPGVGLVDRTRKQVPLTACGWQHFGC
jgi:hypothetical protein